MYTEEKIVLEKLFNLSSQLSFTKQTMLYLIGLGLSYESDITVRGLETVKKCKRVYLEAYTSILMAANQESLEKFYGREIILADRELVETGSDDILKDADKEDVAFWLWETHLGPQHTQTWSFVHVNWGSKSRPSTMRR